MRTLLTTSLLQDEGEWPPRGAEREYNIRTPAATTDGTESCNTAWVLDPLRRKPNRLVYP
jgi:hypothetical protein